MCPRCDKDFVLVLPLNYMCQKCGTHWFQDSYTPEKHIPAYGEYQFCLPFLDTEWWEE